MGSGLNFILFFSGLWAVALCASRQYYVVEAEKPWDEAQKWCRENYDDLATIENDEEMNTVKNLLRGKPVDFWTETGNKVRRVWIGLKQNKTFWDISKTRSWYWSDRTPFNYTYWCYGEPNNDLGTNCVELYQGNNTWNDAGCDHENPFICYNKRTPLIVIKEEKTWREALRFCRENHVNLVSVQSEEMQDWVGVVTQNAFTNVTSRVWIGLRHTCALGFWYWVTGETICYQNWAPGNGTGVEDCGDGERTGAMLSDSKQWISLPETQKLPFICVTF